MPRASRRQALAHGLAWMAGIGAVRVVHGRSQRGLDQFLAPVPPCKDDKVTPAVSPDAAYRPEAPARTSLAGPRGAGERVVVAGYVIGVKCGRIKGARVDFWQADASGAYPKTGFDLRGHQITDAEGRYRLETVRPGATPGRARHLVARVEPPGQPALTTALYFPDDPDHDRDRFFTPSLLMRPVGGAPPGTSAYAFDFILDL